jgi:iron complex transport system substrate-binding protein
VTTVTTVRAAALAAAAVLCSSCASAGVSPDRAGADTVTVTNCGAQVDFPSPARRLFVNDGNLVSLVLAIGAEDQVGAVSSIGSDVGVLTEHYGPAVADLHQVSTDYPGLETVIAQRPDVMVAGWSYGFDEATHVTPAALANHDIASYVLTESCRQPGGARGVVDPWTALEEDLANMGAITGREDEAAEVARDVADRLAGLERAPRARRDPVLFVFDSGERAIFTSGRFGAPQAIIDAAGGRNAVGDIQDSWTEVSWERLAAARPDAFLFVDYPGQTFAQKVAVLSSHPATRDLPAVRQRRFVNLPYAMWTSGPLNIDAAEEVREHLEEWELVPPR